MQLTIFIDHSKYSKLNDQEKEDISENYTKGGRTLPSVIGGYHGENSSPVKDSRIEIDGNGHIVIGVTERYVTRSIDNGSMDLIRHVYVSKD